MSYYHTDEGNCIAAETCVSKRKIGQRNQHNIQDGISIIIEITKVIDQTLHRTKKWLPGTSK